jgi:DNA repair protein SbcC/Rad50
MIPVRLSLHNFMCYRDVPPLSFDGIHTACISGDNGHGKSTLIDAVTWALWGQARGKSDDELIHQGQAEMSIEFDFSVGQQVYRIIRKRMKPKGRGAGQSLLELQLGTGNGFRPVTGTSISETQQKIISTLHMNYDTFVNSAYLRQGHSDEFTQKRPSERKEVLASILQLSRYDELAEQARNLFRKQEAEIKQLEVAVSDINAELAHKPQYESALARAQEGLVQIVEAVKTREAEMNGLRRQTEALKSKQEQMKQLEEHILSAQRDMEQWQNLAQQHHARIREYEDLIARRQGIEQGYEHYSQARKLCDELSRKARQSAELGQQKHRLEMAIERAQQELIKQHDLIGSKIADLDAKSQKLPQFKHGLQKMQLQLRQAAEQEQLLENKRKERQGLQIAIKQMESDISSLTAELAEVASKIHMLRVGEQTNCPLCETELGADGFRNIEGKYDAERNARSELLESHRAGLPAKKDALQSLENAITEAEGEINRQKALIQGKIGALTREIEEAENAWGQMVEARKTLTEIEQRLASKDFIAAEMKALFEIDTQLEALRYDPKQYDLASQQLDSLQRYEKPKQKLEEADRLVEQERKSASAAEEAAARRQQALEKAFQSRQSLSAELADLPRLTGSLNSAEAGYKEVLDQQKLAQETLANAKVRLEYSASLEAKKSEKEKQHASSARERDIYKHLAEAFGKSGIQAMLIETAIPEIEAEADKLLSRMTDNRMHLKIEAQRQIKTGETRETLDINISDELGTRNYEMFSGGESFRIDFAIRVALARLLARRAGAPLRTLIIDEGFGTQDSSGIEKIKEAINSIQDDFDKILVITHIEELRDAFPTRIDVKKTAEGSAIELN